MPKNSSDLDKRIALAAEMHYLHNMSQKEIAKRLGVSRPWVSKLLKKAQELGIVRIEVNSPLSGCPELEEKIKQKYRIENVMVINPSNTDSFINVGQAAANYLVSRIMPGDTIGVSWGLSIAKMIESVMGINVEDVTVIPLVGGAGSNAECLSNVCADRLANALGAKCELLHANAYCSDETEYNVIMSNPMTKNIIERGEHADIALVGIGALKNSRIFEYGYVDESEEADLERLGAVGDIALRFIDKGGEVIDTKINNRVIASQLEEIRKNAREVIAIAFGEEKVEVIKAALKGGLITTLFTDYETAEKLVD